jgi:predicted ATPase with chaperone activity
LAGESKSVWQSIARNIFGFLLDRIDIHVDVPRVNYEKLADDRPSEASAPIRERVIAARERQAQRFAATPKLRYPIGSRANKGMAGAAVSCRMQPRDRDTLEQHGVC